MRGDGLQRAALLKQVLVIHRVLTRFLPVAAVFPFHAHMVPEPGIGRDLPALGIQFSNLSEFGKVEANDAAEYGKYRNPEDRLQAITMQLLDNGYYDVGSDEGKATLAKAAKHIMDTIDAEGARIRRMASARH